MTVAAILRTKGAEVLSLGPDTALVEAARLLVARKIGAVLVRAPGGEVLGILSERDVVRLAAENGSIRGLAVQDAMTRVLHTVTPATSLTEALEMMTDRRVRHLPVLQDGELRGIVSIGDLVKARIEDAVGEATALREYVTSAAV